MHTRCDLGMELLSLSEDPAAAKISLKRSHFMDWLDRQSCHKGMFCIVIDTSYTTRSQYSIIQTAQHPKPRRSRCFACCVTQDSDRWQSSSYSTSLQVCSQHISNPSILLYDSEDFRHVECGS